MDTYRQLQAERWRKSQLDFPVIPRVEPSLIKKQPKPLTPEQEQSLAIVAVDESSLKSIQSYLQSPGGFRNGILFGTLDEDGVTVIVDAIYETTQDNTTGEPLIDGRLRQVKSLSKLMGLEMVGLLVTTDEVKASHLCKLLGTGSLAHVLLMVTQESTKAIIPTVECFNHVKIGELTSETTLFGRTHGGGLDGKRLQREVPVVKRTVNTIVHTGFYRLNRPNHTPTINDARAFILARREKAKIKELHLQFADYHLLLWIGDALGEHVAERVIIAIHQEDDSLVEDLVELLLSSNHDL